MKRILACIALLFLLGGQSPTSRVLLTDPVTFYISSSGSDLNNCTSQAPCATAQYVWNTLVTSFDMGGQTVTIQFADGSYPGGVISSLAPTGGGLVVFQGHVGTNTSVTLSCGSVDCFQLSYSGGPNLQFSYLTTSVTGSSLAEIDLHGPISAQFTGHNFTGGGGYGLIAEYGANVYIDTTNWNFGGTWSVAVFKSYANALIYMDTAVATTTVATTFTEFVYANGGYVDSTSMTFTASGGGSYTGARYLADRNGVIDTHGGGANYFPGNGVGSTASGGQYL